MSRENRLSARTLTTLLAKAGGDHRLREVFSQLPVAKATGSLKTRFDIEEGVPGIGRVRAKTGVLTGARALAGIATTANGHPVIFATLINESTDDWVAGEWVIEVSALLAAAGTPR